MSKSNWFARQGRGFQGVERPDGHIDLEKFLPAAEGFISILAEQKARVFIPVRERFGNNVRQIKTVAKRFPELKTLSALINKEIEIGESDIDAESASRGVVWFTRACQFLLEAFDRSLATPEEPLATSFRESYEVSLIKHHDGIVKHLFNLAMSFCPKRDAFYGQLQGTDDFEVLQADANVYFTHMRRVKNRLVQFCRYHGWDVSFRDESADIYTSARQKMITTKPRPVENLHDARTCEAGDPAAHNATPPTTAARASVKRPWRDDLLEDNVLQTTFPGNRVHRLEGMTSSPIAALPVVASATLANKIPEPEPESDPDELIA